MNKPTRRLTLLLLASSLLLTSCENLGPMLENTGGMAGLGAAAGAIIGGTTGNPNHRHQRAVVGGLIGAGTGAAISMAYKFSVQQRQYAQARANYALANNRSVMKSVKASDADYLMVPVRKERNNPKSASGLARVKVKKKSDGTLEAGSVDSTVYPSKHASSGSVMTVAGQDAVFYQP